MSTGYNLSYYIHTLGCKVNQYDSHFIEEELKAADIMPAKEESAADVIIINTCTVTNTADKKSRFLIRRTHKLNPSAKIIVCGCMASAGADKLEETGDIDVVVTNENRADIVKVVKGFFLGDVNIAPQNTEYLVKSQTFANVVNRTRKYIKIQDGCNNACAYCIIPSVRGRSTSREASSIIKETINLERSGAKEIVLTGIHICSYNDGKYDLLGLLRLVEDTCGNIRFRLGSLDPRYINADWLFEISGLKKICPHFHISLQSGCDSVLKRMGRGYAAGYYRLLINKIRKLWDNPAITTDIITGFPGESESDFFETVQFARLNKFAKVHVFPYSEREGTKAAALPNSLPVNIRRERADYLIKVGQSLQFDYLESCLGKYDEVIFETKDGAFATGRTSRYVKVRAKDGEPGQINKVITTRHTGDILECEIIG